MKISQKYNEIYGSEKPFGTEAHWLVKKIVKYKKVGSVLDLGAGQGRNALFLAQKGFNVAAVDISPVGIENLLEQAKKFRVKIGTEVGDLRNLKKSPIYDIVLAIFVLHHLDTEETLDLLTRIKQLTALSGLNVISAFTKDGDFYRKNPERSNFYPDNEELKKIYSSWKILFWEEKETRAYQKREDGSPMINTTSFLIAQKS